MCDTLGQGHRRRAMVRNMSDHGGWPDTGRLHASPQGHPGWPLGWLLGSGVAPGATPAHTHTHTHAYARTTHAHTHMSGARVEQWRSRAFGLWENCVSKRRKVCFFRQGALNAHLKQILREV